MRETWGRFPASISPYPEGNAAMTDILKLFIVLAAGSFSGLAAAQGAVSVQPNAIIHSATPGGSITQQLRLDNPGTAPLNISVYPGDWQHDSSGQVAFFPAGTFDSSAADWLSFDVDSLQLNAGGQAFVNYTVAVPADAAPGSYWAALFAEGVDPTIDQSQAITTFRLRTAHILYVNVPPATTGGRITGILGQSPATEVDPYTMQLTYLNEGNTIQILSGRVEIRSVTGELLKTITLDRHVALPGVSRSFTLQVYGPMPAGDYLALALLNYGDVDTDVAGEFVFSLDQALTEPEFRYEEAAERLRQLEEEQAALEGIQ